MNQSEEGSNTLQDADDNKESNNNKKKDYKPLWEIFKDGSSTANSN